MLPFVFNADDDGKRVQNEEANYDPNAQRQQMEDYYKQYEQQRVVNAYQSSSGRPDLAAMQARLAETEQAIQRLNQEKEQNMYQLAPPAIQHQVLPDFNRPPPGFPHLALPPQSGENQGSSRSSNDKKRSRSPSWAREARRSRSRSRERRGGRSRSRSGSRRKNSRDRRDDRSSRRRRDRSHSRSRSPPSSANGSHYRSSSHRHSRRRRSRSSSRDRDWNSRRSNTSNNDRYSEWNPGNPSNKLAIMNMPNDVDNTKITLSLGKCGYLPQDVRTMTKFDKNSKQIRTFAFVEFSNLETAEQWMADYQGWLTLDDGRTLAVEYAKGDPAAGGGNKGDDWICAHCSMNNFVKRQTCFKCEISKEQSMELEKLGAHMVGMAPCDTLLIRGLPDGITNSLIFDSLGALVCLSSISMIKLSDSKRFAYLQMKSTEEAKMLLNLTYKSPIRIKEKDVQVSWCRDSMSKLIQQQMTMLTAGPGKNAVYNGVAQGNMTGAEIAAAALSKAHAVRQASHQVGQIMTGFPATGAVVIPPNFNVPPPNMAHPPPVQPSQPEHQNGVIGTVQTPKGSMPKYLPPNPLTFVHDPNVGYYVDPVTKFCYDSSTGYYFNNATGQWCTWDLTLQTYFPVETAPEADSTKPQEDPAKPVEEEAPKTAQDLAKDMAKWAKKQEKDKKKVQISLKGKESKGLEIKNVFAQEKRRKVEQPSAFNDDFEEEEEEEVQSRKSEEAPSSSSSNTPYALRKPNLQDVRDAMERALYDEAKKTCLLCKRAFSDVEVLRKHVEKSDLHRVNLEAKRAEWGRETAAKLEQEEGAPALDLPKIVYRDRAKERRRQFGVDSTGYAFDVMGGQPGSSTGKNEEAIRRESEEASKRPLDDTNIGNRLLKSMGWKEGQGVGKHGQGIVNPIQAERFVQGAGLGAAGSKMKHGAEASHKEKTRQALYSRYHDA
ncbi:hypothetical protein L3Y34_015733 [Caenorhabditis briggsae]|uniref:Uncharacterized protein n=1 Tax=Caenorhabditis briggsae TaxID=6238 RepID=A0AAE9J053_CAEBR|nr:hypothetical protein L3Y34_015733 [Caenorhabditis briggsae]